MCINVIKVSGIDKLPEGVSLEEVSVYCQLPKGPGQIVLPRGMVEQDKLFETNRKGEKIIEERFKEIRFITYIER